MLAAGSPALDMVLTNQHGDTVDLCTLRGQRVLVLSYPKANTPGCTQQAFGVGQENMPKKLLEAVAK